MQGIGSFCGGVLYYDIRVADPSLGLVLLPVVGDTRREREGGVDRNQCSLYCCGEKENLAKDEQNGE